MIAEEIPPETQAATPDYALRTKAGHEIRIRTIRHTKQLQGAIHPHYADAMFEALEAAIRETEGYAPTNDWQCGWVACCNHIREAMGVVRKDS